MIYVELCACVVILKTAQSAMKSLYTQKIGTKHVYYALNWAHSYYNKVQHNHKRASIYLSNGFVHYKLQRHTVSLNLEMSRRRQRKRKQKTTQLKLEL